MQKLSQNPKPVPEISIDDVRQHRPGCSQRRTQANRILAKLIEARGDWLSVLAISIDLGILQFSARLHELRAIGFVIENRMETMADGTKHSFYRLISSSAEIEKLRAMPGLAKIAAPPSSASITSAPIDIDETSSASARSPAQSPALSSAPAPEAAADWCMAKTGRKRAVVTQTDLFRWER